MNGLRIVPFDKSYLKDMISIEKASFSDPWSEGAFTGSAELPFTHVFLALDAIGNLCGYVVFSVISPECEIQNIAVSPELRRQKIADSVMEFVFERAAEEKCDKIMLEVRASNAPAISLYKKHGFHSVGIRKKYYTNPLEDAILMDKTLTNEI